MIAVLISGVLAIALALAGTPLVIRYFRAKGFAQPIRTDGDNLPPHEAKAGTPTMGGAAIVLAASMGFLVGHVTEIRVTPAGWLMLFTFIAMGVVGFVDDFIKVRRRRSLGLSKTSKFVGQALVSVLVAWLGPRFADIPQAISIVGELSWDVPVWVFAGWVFLMIAGFSNAVNLTDGLDGLVAGSSALVFGGYALIGFWMFRNSASYQMVGFDASLDVAVMGAGGLAACAGFLWYNAPPAKVYMGDTGSLAIGGLFATMAMVTGTQFLLVVLGGLYVVEVLSVVVQVVAYRLFNTRALRMAPIHHHFEVGGWPETTVVVRFWIVAGLGVVMGLGLFYAEWIGRVGVGP